jgi:hypothetical protein
MAYVEAAKTRRVTVNFIAVLYWKSPKIADKGEDESTGVYAVEGDSYLPGALLAQI